jgi:hypothetical protein
MFLALEARTPCVLCGYLIRALLMDSFRINKRSIRKADKSPAICWVERHCPECGTRNHHAPEHEAYRITEKDRPKVAAYRAKKWGVAA